MAMVIILNSGQANAVAGPSSSRPTMAALNPIALTDGTTWILPAEVLTDPDHLTRRAGLQVRTQVDASTILALLPNNVP